MRTRRFALESEFSERDRYLQSIVVDAFPTHPVPDPEVALVDSQGVRIREFKNRSWLEVYQDREESVHMGDWIELTDVGFAYYLPTYLLCTLDPDESYDLDLHWIEYLPDNNSFLKLLSTDQRKAACCFFGHWSRKTNLWDGWRFGKMCSETCGSKSRGYMIMLDAVDEWIQRFNG